MTTEQIMEFRTAQLDFYSSAVRLLEAWKDGGRFTTRYPFSESFDEMVARIAAWMKESKSPELPPAEKELILTDAPKVTLVTPDSPHFFDLVARQIQLDYPNIETCSTHYTGGGIWCVEITRKDGIVFLWGTANDKWGSDVFPSQEKWGELEDSLEINVPSDSPDLEAVAHGIVKATTEYKPKKPEPIKATLTISVRYDPATTNPQYIRDQLDDAANFLVSNGMLSGNGPAVVDEWDFKIDLQ